MSKFVESLRLSNLVGERITTHTTNKRRTHTAVTHTVHTVISGIWRGDGRPGLDDDDHASLEGRENQKKMSTNPWMEPQRRTTKSN